MTTWITICDTCKRPGWDQTDMAQTDGEALAGLIEAAAKAAEQAATQTPIKTRRVSCTMGCERACNVIVQGTGKIGYSMGTFEPTAEAATGIVGYAALHSNSDTGQVPYREWPQAVKGHFVSRHLPPPRDPASDA